MATPNLKPQSAAPQAKVSTLQSFRKETPEHLWRRERLGEGLNVITGVADALLYVGEFCQDDKGPSRLAMISVGMGEVLRVVHHRMAGQIEVES
jgi:hypothetical protein